MDKFIQVLQEIEKLPVGFAAEEVDLDNAFNRVLRENIFADLDMPPFNKSAMDGYACRMEDIGNELKVLDVLHAGKVFKGKIGINQCVKIMTGAPVPQGAGCVFKVEDSVQVSSNVVKCVNENTAKNICYRGEDYKAGEVLIREGAILNASHMAVLAGCGMSRVKVSKMPGIELINTGSELVSPEQKPLPGQIRNSNASQVVSQLRNMGIEIRNRGIVKDDYDLLLETFTRALEENDIVLFTGGASVGDFDWVPKILADKGFQIFWDRTGLKPGNPMTFSRKGDKYCIGLSGNPVSSLVQFELIGKPVLYKLMGGNYLPVRIEADLAFNYRRRKGDRMGIVPVVINRNGKAEAVPFNGSAHINALVYANALMEVPAGQMTIQIGEKAYVRPL